MKQAIIDLTDAVKELVAAIKEGKEENSPTPPIRRKPKKPTTTTTRAREKFLKPTVEEVAAYIREKGFPMECIAKKPRLWDTQIFFEKSFHPIKSRV